jgi:hypothetical protein
VSIGVRSDSRITPKLECQHTINFDRLAKFLQKVDGVIQRPIGIGDLTNKILSLIGATKRRI